MKSHNSFCSTLLLYVCLSTTLLFAGCSHSEKAKGTDIGTRLSSSEYKKLIKRNTLTEKKYSGFYNTFEVSVVYLNSDAQSAILQKKSDTLRWDRTTGQTERDRMFQENSTDTKFFVSLFTPNSRLNDLHKANTNWKIYLETEGRRVEGRAVKLNEPLEVLQQYYSAHNRFSTGYEVIFPIPLNAAETSSVTFILTSALGEAELKFPARQSSRQSIYNDNLFD